MEIYNRPWPLVPNKVRADGGRELDRFRGVEYPADTPNGAEAWVGSLTRANGTTRENPNLGYAEVILPDGTRDFLVNVVKRAPETILGKAHMEKYGTSLGMLIKMLDAKAPFLLQCHPTRENARKYWNSRFGKEECWYVLGTRKDNITQEKFEAAYRKGDAALLESFCHKIPVQPGESYMIPGGVPHALGAGCFVAEIQEPSDLTAVPFPQEYLLEYRRKANPFGIFEPEDEQLYESRMLNSFHYEGLPLDKLLDRLKSKEPVLRQEPGGREIEIFGDRDTSYFSCTMVTVSGAMARKNTGDVQIGIVVGGGNFWRGLKDGGDRMERTRADHMGMLATVINCLALADSLEQRGVEVRVQTAIEMSRIAEPYIRGKAIRHLEKGRVVIFGCGTGNPFFSTDTGAVLRAAEINADAILLAKNVDGVYSDDPVRNPDAVKFDEITYDEVLAKHLMVMDSTATSLSMDNHIPIILFALKDPDNIYHIKKKKKIGTVVKEEN